MGAALAGRTRGGESGQELPVEVVDCLLDPGSGEWYLDTEMDELLETDFAMAARTSKGRWRRTRRPSVVTVGIRDRIVCNWRIALVVTTDGLPLAYEVMKGNRSDRTTLPGFLKKIDDSYGKRWR